MSIIYYTTPNGQRCISSSRCGNSQDIVCVKSSQCSNESNSPTGGNTQKSVCVKSGTCLNDGTHTKVISVRSDNCKNEGASGSTTFCLNDRIITRPNS